jgi:hypothetical protein
MTMLLPKNWEVVWVVRSMAISPFLSFKAHISRKT